ncbi:MAG TPA: prenyltransferase/squalene oxidase repeat-containing protein [Chloroflexota bacterium]|nr:prenyltransferase/squalene oxidase repeat-containing protein [Chloroflexota bacterium]
MRYPTRLGEPAALTLAKAGPRPGIAGTAYDTAWLASIPADAAGSTRFPTALQWLVDNQHPDGSWGSKIQYEHDRIISTLAALVPLAEYGRRTVDRDGVADGTRYLWQRSHLLRTEPVELVATELLLPSLVLRARQVGISVPLNLDVYKAQRAEKLRLIPQHALYSPRTTAVHSLEFLGEEADSTSLRKAQGENGGVGNSPAATAYFYTRTQDRRALAYLRECQIVAGGTTVPVLAPCETFELVWSAYHLFLAGVPVQRLLTPSEQTKLHNGLKSNGVSLSETFPIADADDTAVALTLLADVGGPRDAAALHPFALPGGNFASFPYERHPSIGVNLHVLQTLLRSPDFPNRDATLDRLVDYVASQQIAEMYWLDKWHISPYYATCHALCCQRELDPERARKARPALERARAWIRSTQNRDGSWGFYGQPTAEETAYAVLALAAGSRGPVDRADWFHCHHAIHYLLTTLEPGSNGEAAAYPALWIDKCLYTPTLVVQSVIEAAFIAFARLQRAGVEN